MSAGRLADRGMSEWAAEAERLRAKMRERKRPSRSPGSKPKAKPSRRTPTLAELRKLALAAGAELTRHLGTGGEVFHVERGSLRVRIHNWGVPGACRITIAAALRALAGDK